MQKHHDALEQLANARVDDNTKRQLILKPGGSGFLGGVMIRCLLRWDGQKTVRKFGSPRKKPARPTTSKKRVGDQKKNQLKRQTNLTTIDDRFVTARERRRPVRPLSPTPSPPSFSDVVTSTPLSSRRASCKWTPVSSTTMSQTSYDNSPVVPPLSLAKRSHQGSFLPISRSASDCTSHGQSSNASCCSSAACSGINTSTTPGMVNRSSERHSSSFRQLGNLSGSGSSPSSLKTLYPMSNATDMTKFVPLNA